MNNLKRWLVTMGGVGYLPASGTFASLLTCLILWPLLRAAGNTGYGQSEIAAIGLIFFSVLNILLGKWAVNYFGTEDPSKFVLDEAAGICMSILLLPPAIGMALWIELGMAFLAFRVLDISKPPPARQLENLPHGWGILLDDLAAGIYANIICQLLMRWLLNGKA